MASLAPTTQSDALEQSALAQLQVPEPALRALRRARELERELALLRGALVDLPDDAQPDTGWHDQAANLLSRVVLFRAALAKPPVLDEQVTSSA
jgi:hypothetical protein